jgi:hypothetical protein
VLVIHLVASLSTVTAGAGTVGEYCWVLYCLVQPDSPSHDTTAASGFGKRCVLSSGS